MSCVHKASKNKDKHSNITSYRSTESGAAGLKLSSCEN